MHRTYFDHAATSWPRMPGVVDAMARFESDESASAGRGGHSSSTLATAKIEQLRLSVAKLINASADNIAFFSNGTTANNYALAGLLKQGDHVVTTQAEHNSVLRPLQLLQRQRGIDWSIVPVDSNGRVDPLLIEQAIQSNTKLIVCTSASNVTGACNDLEALGAIARRKKVRFMVDAAQSLGYQAIDVRATQIDILASPGHKGAGGPLGTGVLFVDNSLHSEWQPLWIGGTGEASDEIDGEFDWQQVAESGNRNTTSLVGWLAGIGQLDKLHGEGLFAARRSRLLSILEDAPCGRLIGHNDGGQWMSVFSLDCSQSRMHPGLAPSDWSAILDSSFKIETRAGFHCAAKVHDAIGTKDCGGTLRFSIGHTTTDSDLDVLEAAFRELKTWKN